MKEGNYMVNVIGLGYIGLPTALMLAAHGVNVVGTDINEELVANLQVGRLSFEEEGLNELFRDAVAKGIRFTTEYIKTDMYIVAVPTPYDKLSKKIDPSYVIEAVQKIMSVCLKGATVVIESTISPGTIDKYVRPMVEAEGLVIGKDLNLVHAPERVIPGSMIRELKYNSRTIGVDDPKAGEQVKKLYSTFCQGDIVITDIRTAEMTKVVENTYRDINIAFANELAKICREGNLDVYEIIRIANMHPRVNILQPGPGVGGHCISVDPWFLVGDYPGLANIILAARKINDSMPEYVLRRVHEIMKENKMEDLTRVGLYGLTYKENVNDVRESPTLQLLEAMEKHLAPPLKTYDPYVKKDILHNQYHDFDTFLKDVDLVVIMVAHDEIKDKMDKLKGKIILDTKNICNLEGVYKL
jgi:UDP-N-acetyl-D-mannosaminuronic acid dehydrogenase